MEAGFYPGLVLDFTYWSPSKPQARAVSLLMVGGSFALVWADPSRPMFSRIAHWLGYAGWRWIFIVEGAIACVAGAL